MRRCVLTRVSNTDLICKSIFSSKSYSKKVKIKGWIASKYQDYILLRNYCCFIKCYTDRDKHSELYNLPLETLIEVEGVLKNDCLKLYTYKVLFKPVNERKVDYLKTDIEPVEFARNSIWYFRNPLFKYTVIIQFHILRYVREYLVKNGFVELLPVLISPSSDPGLRGARKLKTTYYGVEYELTSSLIMYKQLSVAIFPKIFYVARNIREEPVENIETNRHLCEFTQIDIEQAHSDIDTVMKIAEKLLYFVTKKIADKYSDIITERIGLRREPVVLKPPFPRITYDEAIELASRLGFSIKWGCELSYEAEKALSNYFKTPIWITNYPTISRGFYYLPLENDPRYNQDFNLILPDGYGEVIDGGSREYRYEFLNERIKKLGEPIEKYSWFLELAKQGALTPSSGWGLGLERLTMYLTGHKNIVYTTMYPKPPGLVNVI
ncbi:MAG: asparagine synthetase A [Desulfurococcaceae archaeon]